MLDHIFVYEHALWFWSLFLLASFMGAVFSYVTDTPDREEWLYVALKWIEKIVLLSLILMVYATYIYIETGKHLPLSETQQLMRKVIQLDNESKREIGRIFLTDLSVSVSPYLKLKLESMEMRHKNKKDDQKEEIPPIKYKKIASLPTCSALDIDLKQEAKKLYGDDGKIDVLEYAYLSFLKKECLWAKDAASAIRKKGNLKR